MWRVSWSIRLRWCQSERNRSINKEMEVTTFVKLAKVRVFRLFDLDQWLWSGLMSNVTGLWIHPVALVPVWTKSVHKWGNERLHRIQNYWKDEFFDFLTMINDFDRAWWRMWRVSGSIQLSWCRSEQNRSINEQMRGYTGCKINENMSFSTFWPWPMTVIGPDVKCDGSLDSSGCVGAGPNEIYW